MCRPFDDLEDRVFLKKVLPDTYEIIPVYEKNAIRCKSRGGVRQKGDMDDDEHWSYIEAAIKAHFKDRLLEIYFNTYAYYQDFVIYLKNN